MIKRVFAVQLDRIYRVAGVASLGLLVINLSVTIARTAQWRGDFYVILATTIVVVSLGVFLFAHLWAGPLDMIRAVRNAQAYHDPMQVYMLTPFERVLWRSAMIPQMQNQVRICRRIGEDQAANELQERIDRLSKWEAIGYIPRGEYPEDLLQYYYGDNEQ